MIPQGFGPWMQVAQTRGRRGIYVHRRQVEVQSTIQQEAKNNGRNLSQNYKEKELVSMGSRFAALQEDSDLSEMPEQSETNGFTTKTVSGTSFTI